MVVLSQRPSAGPLRAVVGVGLSQVVEGADLDGGFRGVAVVCCGEGVVALFLGRSQIVVARGVPLAPSGGDGFKVVGCEGDVVVGGLYRQAEAAAGEDDSGPPGYAGHGEVLWLVIGQRIV